MNSINPAMITLARESRGLTQTDLARLMKVSQGTLSKIEQGLLAVKEDFIGDISASLQYPGSFFYERFAIYPPSFNHHRKQKALPQKELSKINAKINIYRNHVQKFLSSVEIDVNIPFYDVDEFNGPDEVAKQVKTVLSLPSGPIDNITSALEDSGVLIFKVDFGTRKIDGLSVVTDVDIPIIFVNELLPGDRLRFTLAHELGHIVMHHNSIPGPEMESEANAFASEFLMPKNDIEYYLHQLDLEKLAFLKRKWKVAMSALAVRANRLAAISENQYRYLMVKMSERGYRLKEPAEIDVPVEEASLLKELVNFFLTELAYSREDICKLLCIQIDDFEHVYLGKRARLRLVK
ncbi:MAG: ImmA/IrrE family metallo-endopeptidase [Desulfuromonadaceae bacterium]|nr:ImmA/IrrE family metallo-endopeptidase [Desulfuromonadaceae bacterium]